jgi:hypothetical protein
MTSIRNRFRQETLKDSAQNSIKWRHLDRNHDAGTDDQALPANEKTLAVGQKTLAF